MKKSLFSATAFLGAVLLAGAALGQQPPGIGGGNPGNVPQKARPTNTFGTQNEVYVRVSFSQFTAGRGQSYDDNGTGGDFVNRYTTGAGGNELVSALQLPAGATMDYFELDSCEFNASVSTSLYVFDCPWSGTACSLIPGGSATAAANAGCTATPASITPYGPVDNFLDEYILAVVTPAGDGSESLSGVIVGYHLNVSPPPAVASFVDVPTTSPIFKFVEALKASGITAGCDATHYCPNASLTRGQMAVFLAAGLGLSWY